MTIVVKVNSPKVGCIIWRRRKISGKIFIMSEQNIWSSSFKLVLREVIRCAAGIYPMSLIWIKNDLKSNLGYRPYGSGLRKVYLLSIIWLVVLPRGYIYVLQLHSPFTESPTGGGLSCLHKRVPFTSSHAGVGRRREDLLIAHIHFTPDAVQSKPT